MGSIDQDRYGPLKDSGARHQFPTGSHRDAQPGKGYYHLLPPEGIRRLAVHLENGARKYGNNNWRKGQPLTQYINSAQRHIYKYLQGQRDEDHMAAAVWNLMALIETEWMVEQGTLPEGLADLPDYTEYATGYPPESDTGYFEESDEDPEPVYPRYFRWKGSLNAYWCVPSPNSEPYAVGHDGAVNAKADWATLGYLEEHYEEITEAEALSLLHGVADEEEPDSGVRYHTTGRGICSNGWVSWPDGSCRFVETYGNGGVNSWLTQWTRIDLESDPGKSEYPVEDFERKWGVSISREGPQDDNSE